MILLGVAALCVWYVVVRVAFHFIVECYRAALEWWIEQRDDES